MAAAEPDVEVGADEDEPAVPEDELLAPDDDPLPLDPPDAGWADDDPEEALAGVAAALAELCVEAGRVMASPPATARPRTPVVAVTARSRPRARSRCTTAVTVRGSLLFIMTP